ncbi:phage antirepressor Ant [Escherichia coli]|nr:phage antirepressor Ant [Escherichia coli]
MTSQLIPVFNGTIDNETALLCNARDLHAFLGVKKVFASWITERIAEYGFVENQDYILISPNREIKGRGGDRRSKDNHLTLDTAKETAMVDDCVQY